MQKGITWRVAGKRRVDEPRRPAVRELTAEMRAGTDCLAREPAAARLALGRLEAAIARSDQLDG